jgi:hypothetical protein
MATLRRVDYPFSRLGTTQMPVNQIFRSRRHAVAASLAMMCAVAWHTSSAQTVMAPGAESAANPAANVPAVSYRSAFKETSLGVEKDSTDWRKANDEVGKFLRGHADILKWEEQESAKVMKDPMQQPMAEPDAMKKPSAPETAKPIAAPAHKH